MAGVHPDYRDQRRRLRLKLAQREHVLAQGIDLITWTFDPLETRNASLNFHKLGAVCNTYIRNLYGAMRDGLNAGLPSDRFQVDWWIRSERVVERLRVGDDPPPSNSPLRGGRAGGASASPFAVPIRWDISEARAAGRSVLIEIPANFQAIKAADIPLAIALAPAHPPTLRGRLRRRLPRHRPPAPRRPLPLPAGTSLRRSLTHEPSNSPFTIHH